MELPKRDYKNVSQEHRKILGEFYDINKNKQWFHRAEFIELHPTHMKPTIDIYCTYNPVLEMMEIIQFCGKYNIAYQIIASSNQ